MSDLLPVTQADRDAVQAFHRIMAARIMSDIASERPKLGEDEGDAGALVQAFARHRLAAAPPVEGLTSGGVDAAIAVVRAHADQLGVPSITITAASPKVTANASVREAYKQAAYIARRFAEEVNEDDVLMHNPSAISAGNEICHRILKAAASLTDSGTAATIGGERA